MGYKGNQTRVMIKQQSALLFSGRGFKDVTMKDICEATGLSRGGLYRYFGSTAELFEEIWTDMIAGQEDEFARVMQQGLSAKNTLEDVLDRRQREMTDSENSLSLAVYEYSHAVSSSFFERINQNSKSSWASFLQYGIDRGEFNTVDVAAVVDMILFSYQGVRMWSRVIPIEKAADSITEVIKELLIK